MFGGGNKAGQQKGQPVKASPGGASHHPADNKREFTLLFRHPRALVIFRALFLCCQKALIIERFTCERCALVTLTRR